MDLWAYKGKEEKEALVFRLYHLLLGKEGKGEKKE